MSTRCISKNRSRRRVRSIFLWNISDTANAFVRAARIRTTPEREISSLMNLSTPRAKDGSRALTTRVLSWRMVYDAGRRGGGTVRCGSLESSFLPANLQLTRVLNLSIALRDGNEGGKEEESVQEETEAQDEEGSERRNANEGESDKVSSQQFFFFFFFLLLLLSRSFPPSLWLTRRKLALIALGRGILAAPCGSLG